jgi:argininosuccinate lyase
MSGSLFRSRITKDFDDRTAKFHTSVPEDLRIFEDDLNNTTAHDIMLHEAGIIPKKELKMILGALAEIRREWLAGEVEISAKYEDIHEYIESKVIEKIGIEAGGMMHAGRSRNDQVVTDMKLRLRVDLLQLAETVLNLIDILHKRAADHAETHMILYTHGQHAQIGTFGAYLSNYADIITRDYDRIMESYKRVNTNSLGAGPVGGTSIPINRKRTTELLGFDGIHENSIDATSSRDWALETAAVCAILMADMSRIAADILEWCSVEFGYIELADQYSSSSSIMPQKKNPSTMELLRGKTSESYSGLFELLTMVKGVPTGYYQDLQETKLTLWRLMDNTLTCTEEMTGMIATLKVKPEKMWKQVDGSFVLATELAETLVTDAKLSFRESYKVAADLVNLTISRGATLNTLTISDVENSIEKLYKKKINISQSLVDKSTDPKLSLLRRKSLGSPHPDEVRRMVKEHSITAMKNWNELETKKAVVAKALENLTKLATHYSA